jgi:glycosyltransferase involved in cell wall biosynthesis
LAGNEVCFSMKVAVLFRRLGPYHVARLNAASMFFEVHAVEFVASDGVYAWDKVASGVNYQRVTLQEEYAPSLQNALRARRLLWEILDAIKPQAVALPGWAMLDALFGLDWCLSRRVPAILMSESTAWDEPRSVWKEALKRRIVSLFSAGLVGGTPHAEYLASLGMPRDRIFPGYDAVDNQYFADKAAEIRNQRSEIRDQSGEPVKYFLASARFVEKKNLPRLIQAYARYRQMAEGRRHPPSPSSFAEAMEDRRLWRTRETGDGGQMTPFRWQKSEVRSQMSEGSNACSDLRPPTSDLWNLVLLGSGPLKPDLCRLISDLGLVDFVHLPGFKQYPELPEYYALASCFIHPSTTEQWGLVVNEAMASGLPVLVSNRCGCARDLVQEGVNGFTFDPYDVEQMAQLMLKVSDLRFQVGSFGLSSFRIISNWGPQRFAQGMVQAAQTALSTPQPKAGWLASALLHLLAMR